MNILFLEGYYGGSHRAFLDGWKARSRHAIQSWTLPAKKWKWRMQCAAWVFAEKARSRNMLPPDVVIATDMINLAEFAGLIRSIWPTTPLGLYFHENQYTYPPQVDGKSEFHWAVLNSASALAADGLAFNSAFNRRDFFEKWGKGNRIEPAVALPEERLRQVEKKAVVIPVGIDYDRLDRNPSSPASSGPPLLLWNHRWEHDKDPETFFRVLARLAKRGVPFRLAVCGERFPNSPAIFAEARQQFQDRLVHWGFLESREKYVRLLWESDVVVSTARQEFLGLSVLEAMFCGCRPLLPNRLSYPDLLPPELHESCLYGNEKELERKLEGLCRAAPLPAFPARQDFLQPYDWRQVSGKLDNWAESLTAIPKGD